MRRRFFIMDTDDQECSETGPSPAKRAPLNLVTFLVVFGFVWLVFDNMALGLIAGLIFGGSAEVAQRKKG